MFTIYIPIHSDILMSRILFAHSKMYTSVADRGGGGATTASYSSASARAAAAAAARRRSAGVFSTGARQSPFSTPG